MYDSRSLILVIETKGLKVVSYVRVFISLTVVKVLKNTALEYQELSFFCIMQDILDFY